MAEKRQGQAPNYRDLAIALGVMLLAVGLLVGTGLAASNGFRGLSDGCRFVDGRRVCLAATPRQIIKDLLVLSVLAGVFAAAATEFLKRQLRLREYFNLRAVQAFLGILVDLDDVVIRDPDSPVEIRETPLTFGASLSQLCAQLGQRIAFLATALTAEGGLSPSQRSAALRLLLGQDEPTGATHDTRPPWQIQRLDPQRREVVSDAIIRQGERQLDAFQLRTRARWARMMRWVSAAIAAGFMVCVRLAVGFDVESLFVGCLLGLFIGGPVSWAVRDLVRFVEHRAG